MTPVATQQVNRQTALDSSATTAKKMKSCMGNNNSFPLLACYMQQPTFILASQKKEQPAHSRLLLSLVSISLFGAIPAWKRRWTRNIVLHGSQLRKRHASRTICRLRREPARGNRSGKRDNLSAISSLKKTPYRSKVQNIYMQEDTPTGGYWEQQGSGASAYSKTTLFAQAMPLVCVACYTGTMEHRRWGAPICTYQNNDTPYI